MAGLLDFIQGASNAAASNVSAPVDGIAWLLRKAGVPIPDAPVGGSDWMAQKGLTKPANGMAGLLGETAGGLAPILAAAKAPQIAQGLLKAGDNLAAPRTLNPQAGAVYGGDIAQSLNAKYGDAVDAYLGESGKEVNLSKIVVPKNSRQQGIGTSFMNDLVEAADKGGKTVTLTPASDFGGNKARLEKFYKRFDFVPNKGRNKDFAISEAMYRLPKEAPTKLNGLLD